MNGAAHAAAPHYPAHKAAVRAIVCNVHCRIGMLPDDSAGNGKTEGSYGLPRRLGGGPQLGLFLWMRFKLLTVRFFLLCRFPLANGSLVMVLQVCDVPHESHLCEGDHCRVASEHRLQPRWSGLRQSS